jgi:hypothetical protein
MQGPYAGDPSTYINSTFSIASECKVCGRTAMLLLFSFHRGPMQHFGAYAREPSNGYNVDLSEITLMDIYFRCAYLLC